MRVVDQNGKTLTEYDLSAGRLCPVTVIREDAVPVDDITKFAWDGEDYEQVQMYTPDPIQTETEKIDELKRKLRDTDYHIIKVMEGASSLEACVEIVRQRAQWRKEINDLEQEEHKCGS